MDKRQNNKPALNNIEVSFQPQDNHEIYLSATETADLLRIKMGTLYKKVEKGDLPFYRSGLRKLLFSKKELLEYISVRKGKSLTEISNEVDNYINNKK